MSLRILLFTVAAALPLAARAQKPTDANIVYVIDQANAADSGRGALAARKGTRADVRRYGRMVAGEHHALRVEAQALARKLGITPVRPEGDESEAKTRQELDSLRALPRGRAFDRAYVDFEVDYHDHMLDVLSQALDAAQHAELQALIRRATPAIQHHLDAAERIQRKLAPRK